MYTVYFLFRSSDHISKRLFSCFTAKDKVGNFPQPHNPSLIKIKMRWEGLGKALSSAGHWSHQQCGAPVTRNKPIMSKGIIKINILLELLIYLYKKTVNDFVDNFPMTK